MTPLIPPPPPPYPTQRVTLHVWPQPLADPGRGNPCQLPPMGEGEGEGKGEGGREGENGE